MEQMAIHERSFDKGKQIEDEAHIKQLTETKYKARHHRGQDRLINAIPQAGTLLKRCADEGYSLSAITKRLLELLDSYGQSELALAINESLARDSIHTNAICLILERRRHQRNEPPPLRINLPDDPRVRNTIITPHSLGTYDALQFPESSQDKLNEAVETTEIAKEIIEANTLGEK
jgi:hypothetical protein